MQRLWASLVGGYTRFQLSWSAEDKFAAIAGVAENVADRFREHKGLVGHVGYDIGQYVAGMIRGDLLWQMS